MKRYYFKKSVLKRKICRLIEEGYDFKVSLTNKEKDGVMREAYLLEGNKINFKEGESV